MPKNFTQPGETTIGALDASNEAMYLKGSTDGGLVVAGLSSGDVVRTPRLDLSTHTLQTIDYAHHEVHAGSHFFYTDSAEVGSAAVKEYIVATPNTTAWAHMTFQATGSAITQVDLYEGTTRTGTTDVASFNSNRNDTDSATVVVYVGASTDGNDGTLIYTMKSGGATQQSRSSMSASRDEEIILKQNTKYLIRFTSGTAANLCNLRLEWYEHTDKS